MLRRWKYLRTEPPIALIDPRGAVRAVEMARFHLAEEQRRTGKTGEVTARLRELQERNHFADLIYHAMLPSKDT